MFVTYNMCGICLSWETLDLGLKSYASAADSSAASVMALQAHMGMTILSATNACEDTFPWCHLVVYFLSSLILPGSKTLFLLFLLQPSVLMMPPAWAIVGDVFPHFGVPIHCPQVTFENVLEVKLRLPLYPLASAQFPVQNDLQNPPIQHTLYMSQPMELTLLEKGIYAG